MREAIESGKIGFPAADPLPNDNRDTHYFIIGDDAFPLRTWMMKPFSRRNMDHDERIFNYRLSRARRIAENAFGILPNRFAILLMTMYQCTETVEEIMLACCTLHNVMRMRYPHAQNAVLDQEDDNHQLIPGAWRDAANMHDMENIRGAYATTEAKKQRLYCKHYYNSAGGSVLWQDKMI